MHTMLHTVAAVMMIVAPSVLAESSLDTVSASPVVISLPISAGFAPGRARSVDTIVLHSAFAEGQPDPYSVDAVVEVFVRHNVSAHYLIARDGMIYRLVAEQDTSYHAGESQMPSPDSRRGVNAFSIGIELIGGYDDHFTEAQYMSLQILMHDIRTRYPIEHVVAHGEIAGERRSDPWNFDWIRIREWIR